MTLRMLILFLSGLKGFREGVVRRHDASRGAAEVSSFFWSGNNFPLRGPFVFLGFFYIQYLVLIFLRGRKSLLHSEIKMVKILK